MFLSLFIGSFIHLVPGDLEATDFLCAVTPELATPQDGGGVQPGTPTSCSNREAGPIDIKFCYDAGHNVCFASEREAAEYIREKAKDIHRRGQDGRFSEPIPGFLVCSKRPKCANRSDICNMFRFRPLSMPSPSCTYEEDPAPTDPNRRYCFFCNNPGEGKTICAAFSIGCGCKTPRATP